MRGIKFELRTHFRSSRDKDKKQEMRWLMSSASFIFQIVEHVASSLSFSHSVRYRRARVCVYLSASAVTRARRQKICFNWWPWETQRESERKAKTSGWVLTRAHIRKINRISLINSPSIFNHRNVSHCFLIVHEMINGRRRRLFCEINARQTAHLSNFPWDFFSNRLWTLHLLHNIGSWKTFDSFSWVCACLSIHLIWPLSLVYHHLFSHFFIINEKRTPHQRKEEKIYFSLFN